MPPKKIFLHKKKHKHYNTSFRGISVSGGTSAAPGDAPMCAKCPFKKAAKNFQKIFAK